MSKAKTNGNGAHKNGAVPTLSKADVFARDDRPIETFAVAEWGGAVRIRPLSLDAILALEELRADKGTLRGVTALALRFGLVGEDGEPCYSDKEIAQLIGKSHKPVARLYRHIMNISPKAEDAVATEHDVKK